MKQVGNLVKELRGERSLNAAKKHTHRSRETLRKIEAGIPASIKTLKAIVTGLGGTRRDWQQILCAWLEWHARAELENVRIEPRQVSKLTRPSAKAVHTLETRFKNLTRAEQEEILKAMTRPQVLRSIRHLNDLFESASK